MRILQMAATLAVVLSCMLLVIAHHGTASLVLVVLALTGVAILALTAWRRRTLTRMLPRELDRLAWRSDETAVAFIWRFHRGRAARVRIVRSERGFARAADGGAGRDQVCVFDAEGDQAIDRDVEPRRTHFYTLFVERAQGSAPPVCMEIPTLSSAERVAIEATYENRRGAATGPRWMLLPGGPGDPVGDPTSVSSWRAGATHGASIFGEALGGLATDALFAVAELFAGDDPPDGWIEISLRRPRLKLGPTRLRRMPWGTTPVSTIYLP